MTDHQCTMPGHGRADAAHACCRPSSRPAPPPVQDQTGFWGDSTLWRRAAINTGHCLVGCALGDIAAMTLLPIWFPTMGMLGLMGTAIVVGIASSLLLETLVLRWRERLPWRQAVAMAWAMSLISMAAMELVMNAVDFAVMGGQRFHWHSMSYWLAWGPALLAGFFAVLPYNYAKLKRHGRSCH